MKELIASLVKQGATTAKAVVFNVNVSVLENYTRVAFTLKDNVKGYVSQEDGTYKLDNTKVIFVSMYSLMALLKQKELGFVANQLQNNPAAALVLFAGSKLELIQQEVKQGEEYINPFSENTVATTFDHDTIITNVVNFELTEKAQDLVDRLALKLMGI